MVATVTVTEMTGAGPTYTPVDGVGADPSVVRLFAADQATANPAQTTNPVIIPSSSFNYSYWKHVCLNLAGSGFIVSNIRHYSNGDITWTFGSGGAFNRGKKNGDKTAVAQGCPQGNYQQAGGSAGVTGYAIDVAVNGHAYYNGGGGDGVASVNSDTSASPALIDSASYAAAGYTNAVVLQVKCDTVANGAVQGHQGPNTLTWKYDEQ